MPHGRMLLVAAMLSMALAGMAHSEEAAPPPPPAPAEAPAPTAPAAPQKFYLELDGADLRSLAQAVEELPKRIADPLILKLQGQLQPAAQAKIIENKALAERAKKGRK